MPRKAGDAETSMFTRGRIVGMYEGGVPKMMISKKLNIDPKTIRKWILRYEAHGEAGLKSIPKPGAHRKTTAFEDVAIAQAVAVTPTISPQEINKMLGLNISAHTIRRRVRDAKLRSRQEKRENRLLKKKSKGQSSQQNIMPDCSANPKRKIGMKKPRKKKAPEQQQEICMQQNQQVQGPPQQQHMTMAVQHDGGQIKVELKHDLPPVPVMENSLHHQQYISKDVLPAEHVQLTQHQYQPKQMPFYGFGSSTGYEFPRIWTPMTNVNVGAAYCETPKITTYTGWYFSFHAINLRQGNKIF